MAEWDFRMNRRRFLSGSAMACLAAGGLAGCRRDCTVKGLLDPRVVRPNKIREGVFAARGAKDPAKLTKAAVDMAGGMGRLVRRGDVVVVKPNIAWERRPEQAANTNPAVVATLVRLALEAGAGEVRVFDHTCHEASKSYPMSGIAVAAKKAGAKVMFVDDKRFVQVGNPRGRIMTQWPVYRDAMEADVLINVPIVKQHAAMGLTLGMKNLMGAAGGERNKWHFDNLDQHIADLQMMVRPDLVVIDAFRVMMRNGPVGGSTDFVKEFDTVAVSTDIVAADAYAARLFGMDPFDVGCLRLASEMKLGSADPKVTPVHEKFI